VLISAIAGILIYVISERTRGGKSDAELLAEHAPAVAGGGGGGGGE
jgi:hypothetical protein